MKLIPNTSTIQHTLELPSADDITIQSLHAEAIHIPIIAWELPSDPTENSINAITIDGRNSNFLATDKVNVYGVHKGQLDVVAPYKRAKSSKTDS
jgi:hypothetical protein